MALRTFTDRRKLRDGIRNGDLDYNFSQLESAIVVNPDEPMHIGSGIIAAGALTWSNGTINTLVTGTLGNFAKIDLTLTTNTSSGAEFVVYANGSGNLGSPVIVQGVSRVNAFRIRIYFVYLNLGATLPADLYIKFAVHQIN